METQVSEKGSSFPEIWAIGGGKGGTGKSFLISSIGHCLARQKKKIVLIDADFGGANLHTFLGITRPTQSLTSFFEKKVPLANLVVESGIKNMGLLIGTIQTLTPGSMKHTQKLKLFRHIKMLNADYVLLDLGAGTNLNTLDTFLLADKKIIVILPEITAIENSYYFLKHAFFRSLLKSLGKHGFKSIVQETWKNRERHKIGNLNQLLEHLWHFSPVLEKIIDHDLSTFRAHIILNQIKSGDEVVIGRSVKSICRKYFGVDAKYAGYVEYDPIIPTCINKRQPFMRTCPASRCAGEIQRITENLLSGKDMQLKG